MTKIPASMLFTAVILALSSAASVALDLDKAMKNPNNWGVSFSKAPSVESSANLPAK